MTDIHSCHPWCERPICVAVREAIAEEREACAKRCDEVAHQMVLVQEKLAQQGRISWIDWWQFGKAIRARGEK